MLRRKTIPLVVALFLSFGHTYAQRVFATIDPTTIDETLRFDINNVPVDEQVIEAQALSSNKQVDLNFSPNIVFSNDSLKAFVSYPGSDRVLVFDPRSGQIIDLLEVGPNPGQLTISPDGEQIVVPCLHIAENIPTLTSPSSKVGSISIINVETHSVVNSPLENVFLSFANNIVFSSDGETGFLASAGTDQILRFSVDELSEIGSRLDVIPGSVPTSMVKSPTSDLLTVVLIGSTNLSRQEHPDSVGLIDPVSFTITERIAPKTGFGSADEEGERDHILHDFTSVTNFTFSPDGKKGIIADQQTSVFSAIPELTSDRAWVYDFETGEFSNPVVVAGIASGSFYSPTSEFVILGSLTITFVDPVNLTTRAITPSRSNFRPRSRPVFSADGSTMYLGAPIRDSILVINLATDEVRGIEVGGDIERTVISDGSDEIEGSVQNTQIYSSAPLQMSIAPDGEIIAVVNFNANTIDLIKPSFHSYVPMQVSDRELFVGVAISNSAEDETVELVATGFSRSGIVLDDIESTEDVIEFVNPATISLSPRGQVALTADEILQAGVPAETGGSVEEGGIEESDQVEFDPSLSGWIDLDSSLNSTRSFFLSGDMALKRLDGTIASAATSQRIVIPEVQVEDGWVTELFIINPNLNLTDVFFALRNPRGQKVEGTTRPLGPRGMIRVWVKDPDPDDGVFEGLYADSVFEECDIISDGTEDNNQDNDEEDSDDALHCGFEQGYIVVSLPVNDPDPTDEIVPRAKGGVAAFQRYFDSERLAALRGVGVSNEDSADPASTPETHVIPQVVSGQGSITSVNFINPTSHEINFVLELKGNDGIVLAPTVAISLLPGHSLRTSLPELFTLPNQTAILSGWIEVEADRPGLVGNAELSLFGSKALTAVPFMNQGSTQLVFSHVAQGLGMSTGIALINPSSDLATVTIRVFDATGLLVQESGLTLPSNARISQLLSEYFPGFPEQIGGHIEVSSDIPILGLELFFKDDLEFISEVVSQ